MRRIHLVGGLILFREIQITTMATASTSRTPLHTLTVYRRALFNRAFAIVYIFALLALLYRHVQTLLHSSTFFSFVSSSSMLISDLVLAFMWCTTQACRMRPLYRQEFPENLQEVVDTKDFPAFDIIICTADPYKEPPLTVVNTALSVMAYEFPAENISVYVSDDAGSELTLFALMEAAKFARHWLRFCRENKLVERCPDAYFRSNYQSSPETQKIKMMYESMKTRVEGVVERGKVSDDYITTDEEREALGKYRIAGFTRQDHPTVIQVLLEHERDKDMTGYPMPNLIYVSREKSKSSPHHFKAGALNSMLRVSAVLTNAPIVLTVDCDMYSNDPSTLRRVLCYFLDQSTQRDLAYVQFPQRFIGLNKADIYASEFKRLFLLNPIGMDGLAGPANLGTGCFFSRRSFFGTPSSFIRPEIPELAPDHIAKGPNSKPTLELAQHVAGCNYENKTRWGSEIGFKYGSLVEDYFTGYRLHCAGWKSILCYPQRPAFLGDVPVSLENVLSQAKRWSIGLLEVAFSKYSQLTFGISALGPLTALSYCYCGLWSTWSIPITLYAFVPQLTLLNKISIFPKVSSPYFFLYAFLFIGAYAQDFLDFMLEQGTLQRWWSDQRMWLIKGPTCYLFALMEFLTKHLGIMKLGFNVTSKVVDDEQGKRYDKGILDFGVPSPMFVPLSAAAIINLVAFLGGLLEIMKGGSLDEFFVQIFIAGFAVLNCLPIYEAMVLRSDKGRMPTNITVISTFVAWGLYALVSLL